MTAKTLARAAVRLAGCALTRDRNAVHQCFRIKNFNEEEVAEFVSVWDHTRESLALSDVRLIVADSLGGRVPAQFVAEPGLSITHYRNHNRGGLVYLETSAQSDEQGLQNMFSLRDSNFLDGSFDDYVGTERGVPGLLVQEGWRQVGGGGAVPDLLMDRLLLVIRLVHPNVEPVPVRRFISFVELASRLWTSSDRVVDVTRADAIVGEALWAMDMFPDVYWNAGGGDARCRRRLEANARHADLVDGTSELDGSDIEARVDATQFVDAGGARLPLEEAREWKALCIDYARTQQSSIRQRIPYWIFSQLFARDTTGLRLGDKVRAEVDAADAARLAEFDALDVTSGLNARSNSEALRFLEAVPQDGAKPLADLLTPGTRRAVERLAAPPRRRFFNPAIEIVRLVQRARNELSQSQLGAIEIGLGQDALLGGPVHGLFVFMFGYVLRSVAEHLKELPDVCEVVVREELSSTLPPPDVDEQSEDEDHDWQELAWDPLPIRVRLLGPTGEELESVDQLEWCPPDIQYFALFWLLATASDSPYFRAVGALSPPGGHGEDWLTLAVSRELSLETFQHGDPSVKAGAGGVLDELLSAGCVLRAGLQSRGLDVHVLRSFLDAWEDLLMRAREELVPDGVRMAELEAFLSAGMLVADDSGRRLMLPLHPIRLRWICSYMEESRKLAQDFLSGEASFADGEGELYLNWLETLTPSESPPIAAGHHGQLLYSRSELAWHEDLGPMEGGSGDVGLDLHALGSIAQRIINYLEVHPYKRDGLSLLVVLPTSDAMPAELLRKISSRASGAVRISLHVAAPRRRWEAIARNIEQLPRKDAGGITTRLFPDLDLALVDYRAGADLSDAIEGLNLDIALVTHVLQEQVVSQQNTEPPTSRPGKHDLLRHRPLRLESGAGGGAISLVMLPRYPDRVLESWSTLVVRANRSRPVAPSQAENTDFVELRVNFQDSARLFRDLHLASHWVITLERHISREQIESVEAGAPDVLSIEEGVGLNGLKTLIVSSRSGRELIQSRIARKLARLIPREQQLAPGVRANSELASIIYDATRMFSPKLALQALGVARVTEEIVGLTVARRLAEAHLPVRHEHGLSAWISLDEHSGWFGGHSQVRADMCRLSFAKGEDGQLSLDVLVLEGKLRQLYDGHGVMQVRRTCDFFKSVLSGGERNGAPRIDAAMWRELVAGAIETLDEEAVRVDVPAGDPSITAKAFRQRLLSELRSGNVQLRSVVGFYSACLWESDDTSLSRFEEHGVTVLRSTRYHLLDLVSPRIGETPHPAEINSGTNAATPIKPEDISAVSRAVAADKGQHQGQAGGVSTEDPPHATTVDNNDGAAVEGGKVAPPRRGLSDAELRRMYEQILGCFATHGLQVYAAPVNEEAYIEGPASILFKVKPATGVDPRKLSEKAAALKLVLELGQEQSVAFNIDKGFVTVDVPKQPHQRYFVDAGETWTRWSRPNAALAIPIGEDRLGNLVELNFSSPNTPHLLVAGTTGSGKSEALNTILFGLVTHYAPGELKLLLVDPKGTELTPFEGSEYLEGALGWDESDALQLLRAAVDEMQRRYQLFKQAGKRSIAEFNASVQSEKRLPWWVLVLDEYADLTHDAQAKKDIEADLKRLAQKARAAGIHVIIATQKPSAEVISTNLRANLPAQLALRVKSATESRVVMDEAGAETLNGKGDAFLKADGRLVRVQCSRVSRATQ